MSKLNDAIKPWLLANGFKEIDAIPEDATEYDWDYQYHNGEYYIYFDEGMEEVKACYDDSTIHELWDATSEQVISYFTEHGNIPKQVPEQSDKLLAQQMWDYLLSIGFEKIDSNDVRLGTQTNWKYTIAKGSLCAYRGSLTGKFIFLLDKNVNLNAVTDDELNIRSVADLQTWLQDNGYLDAAPTSVSDAAKPENEACFVPIPAMESVDVTINITNTELQQNSLQDSKCIDNAEQIMKLLAYNGYTHCQINKQDNTLHLRDKHKNYLGCIKLSRCMDNLAGIVNQFINDLQPLPQFMLKQQILDRLAQQDSNSYYYIKVAVNGGHEYVKWDDDNWQRKYDYLSTALADDGAYISSNGEVGIVEAGVTTSAI